MPYKAMHPCRKPGCPNLAKSGDSYCEFHKKTAYTRKHPEYQQLYNSKQWKALRRMFLRQHPICMVEGCNEPATIVDHIRDHHGDRELFFSWDNLQSLCKHHHDEKTAKTRGWGKGE